MIELIFVIIIGILVAVAMPKLVATRDDAKISNIVSNARTALGDMQTRYMAIGNTAWIAATADSVTNVPWTVTDYVTAIGAATIIVGNIFLLCDEPTGTAKIHALGGVQVVR